MDDTTRRDEQDDQDDRSTGTGTGTDDGTGDGTAPRLTRTEPVAAAVVRGAVAADGLVAFFDRSFALLAAQLRAQGLAPTGPAHALYRRVAPEGWDLEVGFPVDRPVTAAGGVVPGELPGGPVVTCVHVGPHDDLAASWTRLHEWVGARGLTRAPGSWEVYATEPGPGVDPAALRTELFQPVVPPA